MNLSHCFTFFPPDLEFDLRCHCQRLIVKATPLSGAHLLITSERIAVRAYYPCDILEWIKQKKKIVGSNPDNDDFDGLSGFFSSFQLALVFFIMPPMKNGKIYNLIAEQLDRLDSHFHRAQRLSVRHQEEAEANGRNNKARNDGTSTRKSCVILLPDTQSAIQNLIAIADSLSQVRKASKKAFFQRLEVKFFLPSSPSRKAESASTAAATTVDPAAVASHVEKGLREIARTFEFPMGEADILMSELGDLKTIATANDSLLGTIPIDQRTRKILHSFFGSSGGKRGTSSGRRQAQGPDLSLEQEQFRQHFNLQHLSDVTTQLFPHSNSSRLQTLLTPNSPHGQTPVRSDRHPVQAHHQVREPQYQPTQHRIFDPSMPDESWLEPEDVQARQFPSLSERGEEIPVADNTFATHNENFNFNSGPSLVPTSLALGTNPMVGGNQNSGMHRKHSQFSSTHPSASSSLNASNAIYPYRHPTSSQAYQRGIRFHPQQVPQRYYDNQSSLQQGPYQFPVERSNFSNQYAHAHHPNFQNEMNVPDNSRHYGNHYMSISSSKQGYGQNQHQCQEQRFYHTKGFRR